MSVLIRQAKVVDPNSEYHNMLVDCLIPDTHENGAVKISLSASGLSPAILKDGVVIWEESRENGDAGLCLSPGFVDIFADYCEPGFEHKETIASGLKAAAAGGFTDVLLSPNTQPVLSNKSLIRYVQQKTKADLVSLHPLGAISQNIEGKSLAEMLDMHAHGAIAFTDGWLPVQSANLMMKALEYVKSFKGLVMQIPLDTSLAAGGLMHEGEIATRLGMSGIPVLAETVILYRDLELLRHTQSRLHISGVTTEAGVEMIRRAKMDGLDVSCSVTPYHCALTDESLTNYDSKYKVLPVLRTEQDRQALIAGLKDGTIDCIASHHRPQDWDAKAKEFEYAADGMNLQEVAFRVMLTAAADVPIERMVDAFSTQPRKIFSLPQSVVADGAQSLSIFTTNGSSIYSAAQVQSLSKNNPWIGETLKGKIIAIFNQNKFQLNN